MKRVHLFLVLYTIGAILLFLIVVPELYESSLKKRAISDLSTLYDALERSGWSSPIVENVSIIIRYVEEEDYSKALNCWGDLRSQIYEGAADPTVVLRYIAIIDNDLQRLTACWHLLDL